MPQPHFYAEKLAAVPVERREISLLGGTTAYWVYGPSDANVTIVAVHGFRGDHHGLESVVAHLGGIRVISPDLPGFGESSPIPGRTQDLACFVAWLTAFYRAVAPNAVLLGHSFGSIVTATAVAQGLEVPAVILVNPIGAPALSGPKGIMTRLAIGYYWAGAKLPAPLGERVLRSPLVVRIMSETMAKTKDKALRQFIHDQHDQYFSAFTDRDSLLDAFRTSVSHDVSDVAERITVPTLLVAATQDDITPIEKERELAARMPNARLVEIDKVGHLIHYETPGQAADAIRSFLNERPGLMSGEQGQ